MAFRSFSLSLGLSLCLLPLSIHASSTDGAASGKIKVAVELAAGIDPLAFAATQGATYAGKIGALENYHVLWFPANTTNALASSSGKNTQAMTRNKMDARVRWASVLTPRRHQKFAALNSSTEPLAFQQWHLINQSGYGTLTTLGASVNAPGAWARGITGRGVVVGVVDDGFDPLHVDLAPNYRADLSYDFNFNDPDPSHSLDDDGHSVCVGGVIGAAVNGVGVSGIAYNTGLASLRILSADVTEDTDVAALTYKLGSVDIYNNSWGPGAADTGAYFSPIGELTEKALEKGTKDGRDGKGAIYIWASGNDREGKDRADYDGYSSSRYTISVTAVGRDFSAESYAEGGSCVMVTAPSTDILTTDISGDKGYNPGDYAFDFNGTSAACPMVSGVVALILEVNPNLTWRDVQHILIHSANPKQLVSFSSWANPVTNEGHDYLYGYGLVNADAAVALASTWVNVPAEATPLTGSVTINKQLSTIASTTTVTIASDILVERVLVETTISHADWGDLRIILTSPSGVQSILAEPHTDVGGDYGWYVFSSVRHWGEHSKGLWTLTVTDTRNSGTTGSIGGWALKIHGTPLPVSVNHSPNTPSAKSFNPTTFPATLDLGTAVSDPDNDGLQILSAYSAKGGTLQISGLQLTFTPAPYTGTDIVYYLVSDNRGGTRWGSCIVNIPSYGRNDTVIVTPGVARAFDPTTNDSTTNIVTASAASQPTRGAVNVTLGVVNGTFKYTPVADFKGYDSFTYNAGPDILPRDVELIVMDSPLGGMRFKHPQSRLAPEDSSSVHNQTPKGALTIEAWIYPEGWGYNQDLGYGRIVDQDFAFFINQSPNSLYNKEAMVLYFTTSEGDSGITSPAGSIKLNEWQHVALTYDRTGTVMMYINGKEVTATAITSTESQLVEPFGSIQIAAGSKLSIGNNSTLTRGFQGVIRDVRIWNSVRTQAEIDANKDAVLVPASLNTLVNYWPLNQGNVYPLADMKNTNAGGLQVSPVREGDVFPEFVLLNPPSRAGTLTDFLPAQEAKGDGLYFSDWLGWTWGPSFPFIWHFQHGWLYAATPGTGTGGWVYSFNTEEWWFISQDYYPFIYSAKRGNWLWYQKDTANPRFFFDYSTNTGINVSP
ncbi:MAG: S8 family serine peptidase [Verrucomicrobiota bacterium]|nr:S8 family serine peptidase [Verrucomicrobiota bacterium]